MIMGIIFLSNFAAFSFLLGFQFFIIGILLILIGIVGIFSGENVSKIASVLIILLGIISFILGGLSLNNPLFAAILIGEDMSSINIGPHIPSGMIICEYCGHIDFFALGVLGLVK